MSSNDLTPVPEFAPRTVSVTFTRSGRGTSKLQLRGPDALVTLARALAKKVAGEPREFFFVILLDVRNQVLGAYSAFVGGLDMAQVDARVVFLAAVGAGATGIVLAHNHPSGDPTPSTADRRITDRLRQCGELLGIEVLDHVVIGEDSAFSFASDAVFRI